MRFIDEKGRVFGLVNMLDLAVIILIIAMMIPVAIYRRNRQTDRLRYRHVYMYVKAKAYLMKDVADRIKKGDKTTNLNNDTLIEVASVISNKPAELDAVALSDIALPRMPAVERRSYALNIPQSRGCVFLGEVAEPLKGGIELSSLRLVELSLKLLCRFDRDGTLMIAQRDNLFFLEGVNVDLATERYSATFTITDIGEVI
jgi:hypothetical protein